MYKPSCVSIILSLVFVLACSKESIDPEIVVNIDDEFKIDLWEDLDNGKSGFAFKVESVRSYDCRNNTINYRQVVGQRSVAITFEDIEKGPVCQAGNAPAMAHIAVGELSVNNYTLFLNLRGSIENRGALNVFEDRFEISMKDHDGIALVRKTLLRVPEGSVWGFVAFDSKEDESLAEQFFRDLEQLEQIESAKYNEGYYGYFSLDANNGLNISEVTDQTYSLPFLYQYKGAKSRLTELVERYQTQHGNRLTVNLKHHL